MKESSSSGTAGALLLYRNEYHRVGNVQTVNVSVTNAPPCTDLDLWQPLGLISMTD